MSAAVRDNWERLVVAALRREQLRYLSRLDSVSTVDSDNSFLLTSPFSDEASPDLRQFGYSFSYRRILQATNTFNDVKLIHRGSSGDFYLADLVSPSSMFSRRDRSLARGLSSLVVKRINLKVASNREAYRRELAVLSKALSSQPRFFAFSAQRLERKEENSQPRFCAFLGQCLERKEEKFFVYKFACNGDLSNSLFKKKAVKDDELPSLDWITRMKIARGTAAALAYLHQQSFPSLVHGDLQASSILLDENFEVRLGSLGSYGAQQAHDQTSEEDRIFRDSEVKPSGTGRARDVHCFGKILVELATGKLGISAAKNAVMAEEWLEARFLRCVRRNHKESVRFVVDPSLLLQEDMLLEVWSMCIVAKYCLHPRPELRPPIEQVLTALEHPVELIRAAQDAEAKAWPAAVPHQSWPWPAAALQENIVS